MIIYESDCHAEEGLPTVSQEKTTHEKALEIIRDINKLPEATIVWQQVEDLLKINDQINTIPGNIIGVEPKLKVKLAITRASGSFLETYPVGRKTQYEHVRQIAEIAQFICRKENYDVSDDFDSKPKPNTLKLFKIALARDNITKLDPIVFKEHPILYIILKEFASSTELLYSLKNEKIPSHFLESLNISLITKLTKKPTKETHYADLQRILFARFTNRNENIYTQDAERLLIKGLKKLYGIEASTTELQIFHRFVNFLYRRDLKQQYTQSLTIDLWIQEQEESKTVSRSMRNILEERGKGRTFNDLGAEIANLYQGKLSGKSGYNLITIGFRFIQNTLTYNQETPFRDIYSPSVSSRWLAKKLLKSNSQEHTELLEELTTNIRLNVQKEMKNLGYDPGH